MFDCLRVNNSNNKFFLFIKCFKIVSIKALTNILKSLGIHHVKALRTFQMSKNKIVKVELNHQEKELNSVT
jgi:hypothetical protein